jgi:hypothetical protein
MVREDFAGKEAAWVRRCDDSITHSIHPSQRRRTAAVSPQCRRLSDEILCVLLVSAGTLRLLSTAKNAAA